MARKSGGKAGQASNLSPNPDKAETGNMPVLRSSALLDTRVICYGNNFERLRKLPDTCVDFNSNRNYEVFWAKTKEKPAFEDRHASTQADVDCMRPCCVELARVLKKPAASTTAGTPPIT